MVGVCAIWAAAGLAALTFAEKTAYGPVIFTFDRHHGLHRGDLIAAAVITCCAAMGTSFVLLPNRPSSIDGGEPARRAAFTRCARD